MQANKRPRMDEDSVVSDHVCLDQTLQYWSRNQSSVIRLEHTWVVENFSLKPQETGEYIISPISSDQSDEKLIWKLKLYPKGNTKETSSAFILLHTSLRKI